MTFQAWKMFLLNFMTFRDWGHPDWTTLYLALSFLMLSSQGMSPQNGARTSFFLSSLLQKSSKSKHVARFSSNSFLALCSHQQRQHVSHSSLVISLEMMTYKTSEMYSESIRAYFRPMHCQHFQNPKALRLFDLGSWNLACIWYVCGKNF